MLNIIPKITCKEGMLFRITQSINTTNTTINDIITEVKPAEVPSKPFTIIALCKTKPKKPSQKNNNKFDLPTTIFFPSVLRKKKENESSKEKSKKGDQKR